MTAEETQTGESKMKTYIKNKFTGYNATIVSKGVPRLATLKKHIRQSKAKDCVSVTTITTEEGREIELSQWGEVLIDGRVN